MSGGASAGKGESSSNSGSKFNQNVWGPQSDALSQLYANAGNLFSGLNSSVLANIPGMADYANNVASQAMPGWQSLMQGGVYQNMDLANNLMGSLNRSMDTPSATQEINNMIMGGAGNNYADAMKQTLIRDATDAQNNMLANMDARAAASGMSGGSRHGTAIARGMGDINKNLQSNMANIGYSTFDKDLDRKLQIAGMADANTLSRQQMMQQMLGEQQNTQTGALANSNAMQNLGMGSFASYMLPWQMMGAYANTIGGPTVLSNGGSSSSSNAKGSNVAGYGSK